MLKFIIRQSVASTIVFRFSQPTPQIGYITNENGYLLQFLKRLPEIVVRDQFANFITGFVIEWGILLDLLEPRLPGY